MRLGLVNSSSDWFCDVVHADDNVDMLIDLSIENVSNIGVGEQDSFQENLDNFGNGRNDSDESEYEPIGE